MCGRIVQEISPEFLENEFHIAEAASLAPFTSYNIGPTVPVCTIRSSGSGIREARYMRWGMIPNWIRNLSDFDATTFNARDDRISERRMYAPAFERRRCIVPASGYFEWKKLGSKDKQAYY